MRNSEVLKAIKAAKAVVARKAKKKKCRRKISAAHQPNLRKVKKLADREILSVNEFIGAVAEALKSQQVSSKMIEMLSQVLHQAIDNEADTVDMEAA